MENVQPVIDVFTNIAGVISLPAIIILFATHFLNKRNANKKLDLEEEVVNVSVFNSQVAAFEKLLEESRNATVDSKNVLKEALDEIKLLKAEKKETAILFQQQNIKIENLRALFQTIVNRANIELTDEERAVLEETKPAKIHLH